MNLAAFIQPFVGYTFKTRTTQGTFADSTYHWMHSHWAVPVTVSASQLLLVGS